MTSAGSSVPSSSLTPLSVISVTWPRFSVTSPSMINWLAPMSM
jgi:hypothetical protein